MTKTVNSKVSSYDMYLALENVESGTGEYIETSTPKPDTDCIELRKGDVCFGKLRPYLAKVIVAPFDGACSSEFIVLREFKGEMRYLQYCLLNPALIDEIKSYSYGTKMPRTNWEQLGSMIIAYPELEEQRRIVNYLDKVCSMIEYLIEVNSKRMAALDEVIKSRFIEMFGDPFINPKQWKKTRLSNYIQFITSGSRGWKQFFSDDGDLFLTITNVKDCKICLDNVQHVHPPDNLEAERTRVQSGDLLISITADLGRTGVVTKEIETRCAYINQHLTCIRLDQDELNPLYVAYLMESPYGKEQFGMKNKQSVKAGLNFDDIRSLQVLVPPKMLQDSFVSFVEQVDKSRFKLQSLSEQLTIKLKELKQSLIYELVTGRTILPKEV